MLNAMCAKVTFALACLTLHAQRPAVPSIPEVSTAAFLPSVRAQINEAIAGARTHPTDAERVGRAGMVLHAYQQYDAADQLYGRAHDLSPAVFDWLYLQADVEMEMGRFDAAAQKFEAALELQPDNVTARVRLLRALTSAARWQEVERCGREVLKRNPESAQAWYAVGRAQASRGDHAQAVQSLTRACELFRAYGAAHLALASELRRLGQTKQAQEEMAAYAKDPSGEPPLADALEARVREQNHSAHAHLQRGAELEKAGQIAEAIREHEAALETDPANVQANVNLISLYGRSGDFDKAKQHFEAAIRLSPGSADAWYDYGVLLYTQGKRSEAADAFRHAIQINPSHAEAHNNLGAIYEAEGRLDDAGQEFRQAIDVRPNFPLARFHLARILVNQQNYNEAIQQLQRALEPEDERTPTYLYALGAAYARAGDRAQALLYMRRAHDSAAARGQKQLLASIDRDLDALGRAQ